MQTKKPARGDTRMRWLAETNPIDYDPGEIAGDAGACSCRRDSHAGAMPMRPPARPPQERMMLRLVVPFVPFGAVLFLAAAGAALAQEGAPAGAPAGAQPGGAAPPGRAVVLGKCFQCHTDAMFRDQRQDRRAWEATIYRMVGRGALWTPEEIKLMADYLGAEFGALPAAASKPASPH